MPRADRASPQCDVKAVRTSTTAPGGVATRCKWKRPQPADIRARSALVLLSCEAPSGQSARSSNGRAETQRSAPELPRLEWCLVPSPLEPGPPILNSQVRGTRATAKASRASHCDLIIHRGLARRLYRRPFQIPVIVHESMMGGTCRENGGSGLMVAIDLE